MGDAAARSHPVHLAGTNGLLDAQAVAMRDPALEQVADGGESDVGMRPDIRVAKPVGWQVQRAGMTEEDERPDHAALPAGKDAVHRGAAAEETGRAAGRAIGSKDG